MTISIGFYKYVYKWITDEETATPIYRPFEANENPYKASVFIVGSHPTPALAISTEEVQNYANALVKREKLLELFPDYLSKASRDVKGAIRFSEHLKEQFGISSVISYVNALTASNLTDLKKQKKEKAAQYQRGHEIFMELIQEMRPPIILLHGTFALEQFRKNFKGYYIEYGAPTRILTELEGEGVIGKIMHDDGRETKVFAMKSLATFKKSDDKYSELIKGMIEEI